MQRLELRRVAAGAARHPGYLGRCAVVLHWPKLHAAEDLSLYLVAVLWKGEEWQAPHSEQLPVDSSQLWVTLGNLPGS